MKSIFRFDEILCYNVKNAMNIDRLKLIMFYEIFRFCSVFSSWMATTKHQYTSSSNVHDDRCACVYVSGWSRDTASKSVKMNFNASNSAYFYHKYMYV